MYTGSHSINMDAKGRMAVPTRVREMLTEESGGRVVMTANPAMKMSERCLLVYPEGRWNEILPEIQNLPNLDKVIRRTQRLVIGYAATLELDGNGRVLLPPTLREYAGLDKKLMLVGQGAKLELWSEERWNAWMDDVDEDAEIPPEMASLSL